MLYWVSIYEWAIMHYQLLQRKTDSIVYLYFLMHARTRSRMYIVKECNTKETRETVSLVKWICSPRWESHSLVYFCSDKSRKSHSFTANLTFSWSNDVPTSSLEILSRIPLSMYSMVNMDVYLQVL